MICASLNMNMNGSALGSITSTTQVWNAASKVDLVELSSQSSYAIPRIPGVGGEYIVQVTPDFDDTLEMGI